MSPRVEARSSRARFRPKGSRLGLAAFGLMLVLATLALPMFGLASEVRTDDMVTIGSAERIDDDLYITTGELTLAGVAERDVFVAAGEVDISGRVEGSLNIAGGDVDLSGTTAGTVRIAGGRTVVSGVLDGDLMVFGGTTVIESNALIDGDLLVYGGQLDLRGTVGGDVSGTVGSMTIAGNVDGDVDLDVQSLDVASGAEIDGSLDYVSRQDAGISPGSNIAGGIDHTQLTPWGTGDGARAKAFSPLVRTLWLLAAGAIMIALAPRLAAAVSDNVRSVWIPAMVGLISIVLLPMLVILLMISIIGLPVGAILLVLFFISLYLSQVIVGQRLGTLILPSSWNDNSRGFLLLAMTLGVILISVFRFIPLPFVSAAVNLLVAIIGLGAVVLLVRQLRPEYRSSHPL